MEVEPNLAPLKPSRKQLKPGDVFVMHRPAIGFIFGRVIFVGLPHGPMGPGSNLIYVYDHIGKAVDDFSDGNLTRDRLLLPPIFINRLPWTRGYFQNVAYRPIAENDTLEQHYFLDDLRSTILDLDGNDVEEQEVVGPCGSWGLDSYQTVDMYVEQALRKQGQ